MASTLAQLEARVAQLLFDTGNVIFTTGLIDESLRLALHEYSGAQPLATETVITLPADGREIALSSLTGLLQVTEVWWPYDSSATIETWPPNRVQGFRLWWDDGSPVLFLTTVDESEPDQDDEVRVWYTKVHTIQNLDSADSTTLPGPHESTIVLGAAGYACASQAANLTNTAVTMTVPSPKYAEIGGVYLTQFRAQLKSLRSGPGGIRGSPWGRGWAMDKWDEQGGHQP